jgi:phosphatidylethanolamine-binding protein (PEBP) family uncharacterized protein
MRRLALACLVSLSPLPALSFEMTFEWGNLPTCNNGVPKKVDNPTFTLSDVPEGTKFITFKMVDKDYTKMNHGGGTIEWDGKTTIGPGAFSYKSPCPKSGSHTYEWTATASSKKSGGKLGTAKARRDYPE